MKWYFASRTKHRFKIIEISQFLANVGETVTSDWVYKEISQPYEKNTNEVEALSDEVVGSILETDIFVLISDPEGTDMFIELGVSLAKKAFLKKIKIYIVGRYSRRSIMQNHPSIVHVSNVKEIFDKEGINSKDFIVPNFW